jgi:diguanylate cyclase (GGDEF)-like protein/PAS domain S-box-containing protein
MERSVSSAESHRAVGQQGTALHGAGLSIVFLVVVSVLLAGLAGWQIVRSRAEVEAQNSANSSNLAGAIAGQVTHMLEVSDLLLLEVAAAVQAGGLELPQLAALRHQVTQLQIKAPNYMALLLMDRDGDVVADGRGLVPLLPPGELARQFQFVRDQSGTGAETGPLVGGAFATPGTSPEAKSGSGGAIWRVPVLRRLIGPDGGFAGVVLAAWSMPPFESSFAAFASLRHGSVGLFRDDGAMLYRFPAVTPERLASIRMPQALLARILVAGSGEISQASLLDGTRRLVTFVRLPSCRLVVVLGQAVHDVMADWRRNSERLLAALMVMLTMLAALGGLQTHQFARLGRARRDKIRAMAELTESEARYRLLAENALDMIVELDLAGRRTYVSPASVRVLGYTPDELTGVSTFDFVHPEDVELVRERLASVFAGDGEVRGINRCLHKSGHVVWIETSLRLVRDPVSRAPTKIVGVIRDITARRLDEMRIQQLAVSDALTGLGNRYLFVDALKRAIGAESVGCAVLFIDLDKFKTVNDLHGHSAGNEILVQVAERLIDLSPSDAILARLGGDEFALLLATTADDEVIGDVAARIVAGIAKPFAVGGMSAEIGASIGIAVSPRHASDAEALLRMADIAMYEAKRAGGGLVCWFRPEMEAQLLWESNSRARLRQSIIDGEIVPFYQKLVRLDSMRLEGFEVLARWLRPDDGMVTPDRFIPIAEEMGLIGLLFESVLHQACRDAAGWPSELRIAVNVSPLQLQDVGLADRIAHILNTHGIAPHRLEVEITENALVTDLSTAKQIVASLQRIGVQVALDDFGTGFSSVYHLKELHFNRIKIDKSFVMNAATDPECQRYLPVIVGLGKSLGLEVTAEGIEDTATLRRMASLGCDYGQGYLFGRPLPANRLDMTVSPAVGVTAVPG